MPTVGQPFSYQGMWLFVQRRKPRISPRLPTIYEVIDTDTGVAYLLYVEGDNMRLERA